MKKGLVLFSLLAASFAHADDAAIKQTLSKMGMGQADIKDAPVPGLKTVLTNGGVLYITEDGRHLLQGPLYDVSGGHPVNVTNKMLMGKLDALSKEMIVYKAPQEQYAITVFTDITCGYCRKLHEEMSDYNALGITVRYLAFPRQGPQSQAERDMKSIWCTSDPRKAFNGAMKGEKTAAASCDIDLTRHYTLGVQFGVQGTPAMVLSDGSLISGYQGPKELKAFLDQHKKLTAGGQ
ncbi:bifunctional protein-disulfide isomerase/oxidoreductase DsbC [Erwinia sp. CPCC 100877]|nr:bifunctional protein-disulfide isomerase/oxidoreductase DsbC [Erwinia sp. CPCC 100877]